MIDSINKEIEAINSNLSVLPTNNKKNQEKYIEYLNETIADFESRLTESKNELTSRKDALVQRFESNTFSNEKIEMNYASLKLSDPKCASSEKMELSYLIYKLRNSNSEGLSKINELIETILGKFKKVGIGLTEKDFTHTDNVNLYMRTFLTEKEKIQETFNSIYFQDPNLLEEIILNIWYLFYKNKAKIDAYYKKKYENFDFNGLMNNYHSKFDSINDAKHSNGRHIYDMFISEELDVWEFLDVKKMDEISKSLVSSTDNSKNYDNLKEYKKSLIELKGYNKFLYIITDLKELYTHKDEYKDLFSSKLKEISKEEGNLFSLNKKLHKKGLFKPNKQKLAEAKFNRDKSIETLITMYNELDELAIKESIKNYFSTETSYYDALKFTTYNFTYFVKLLEKKDGEVDLTSIERNLLDLYMYIYDNSLDILNHILLVEDKDVLGIIKQKYELNGIVVDEEKVSSDQIDKVLSNIEKMLINYNITKQQMNLEDIKFIIDTTKELTKKD